MLSILINKITLLILMISYFLTFKYYLIMKINFENLNLKKFNSSKLNNSETSKALGGLNDKTYVVSAPKEGDGTITDASLDHNSQW